VQPSPRSVSDLERGINRTARKDTALLLASALSLSGPACDLFVAAARGRASATEVLAACVGKRRERPWPWQIPPQEVCMASRPL
jgi:hypothetical protein